MTACTYNDVNLGCAAQDSVDTGKVARLINNDVVDQLRLLAM